MPMIKMQMQLQGGPSFLKRGYFWIFKNSKNAMVLGILWSINFSVSCTQIPRKFFMLVFRNQGVLPKFFISKQTKF
uniref:Uncharacterized protein n=1 Tax=Arundo donax TaxID=35708 RepID=A0A0A9H348_ARUDO